MYPNMFPYTYGFNPNTNPNNTIPFKNDKVDEEKKTEEHSSSPSRSFNILGTELEIDDLLIVAIICLLFLDFEKNYILVIILGLILLNVNLGDLLNLF